MAKKPRGKYNRYKGFSPLQGARYEVRESGGFDIGAWCPDDMAKTPPTQVHLTQHIQGFNHPVVIRFKSPDTLGFLIEELARYRKLVWPDAEPVDLSGEFPEDEPPETSPYLNG